MTPASSNKTFGIWRTFICLVAFIPSFVAAPAHSQSTGPVHFDIGMGLFTGKGAGPRDTRFGVAAAAQFSGTIWTKEQESLLLAVNVTTFGALDNSDVCTIPVDAQGHPTGGCLENFPGATTTGVLAGIEHRFGEAASLRVLAGPSLYAGNHQRYRVEKSGALARIDVTTPVRSYIAFVLWGEAGLMHLENAPSGKPVFFGLGLRLQ